MPESGRTIRDVRGRRPCSSAMDGCWRWARPPSYGSEQGQRCASSMPGDAWWFLRSPVAESIKETRRTSCSSTIWSRWNISQSSTSNRSCSSCRPAGSCEIATHRPLETAPAYAANRAETLGSAVEAKTLAKTRAKTREAPPAPLTHWTTPPDDGRDGHEPHDGRQGVGSVPGSNRTGSSATSPGASSVAPCCTSCLDSDCR
jgi:hypothetical protein